MKLRIIHLLILLGMLLPVSTMAQTATVKGILQDSNKNPISGITVSLKGTSMSTQTGTTGAFEFKNVPFGSYQLESESEAFDFASLPAIAVNKAEVDLGAMSLTGAIPSPSNSEEIPTITLGETEGKETSGQEVASVLSASRDPFVSAATFNFSAMRFRVRGYANEEVTYVNNLPMEDLSSGRTTFGAWSGLNDVMRSRDFINGLGSSNYSYGSMAGVTNIDCQASKQRKQLQISYAASNRTYDNRIMATYGSGLLKGGWSVAGSLSRRWAKEGYVKGTYYDGWSWFMSVEKKIGLNQSLSLSQIGANTQNGRAGAATMEAYDLAGDHYYNPYWGYQNGKVRNVSVGKSQQPVTILNHEWKIDSKNTLETSLGYQYGTYSTSGFDWYNSKDPRPDYYRNMPSYWTDDSTTFAQITDMWKNNESVRQIDWDGLYNSNVNNVETIHNAYGIEGYDVTGKRSHYIVEDRISEVKRWSFNTVMNTNVSDHFTLTKGFSYQNQNTEYYKRVNDLLGGEFYVDLNQFAELSNPTNLDASQNNLAMPNRILHEGDKFGYDYKGTIEKSMFWAQGNFHYARLDYFLAGNISSTNFHRTGYYQNGVYADNSLGKSATAGFFNFGTKGGLTYKINGRNYVYANASYETRAPLFENSFISPRTQNTLAANLKNETVYGLEGGYLLRAPKVKVRLTGFFTQFSDGTDMLSFYHEDYRSFVNYSLTNIDKRHVGMEIGAEAALGKGFTASTAVSLGQYYYNSRQRATITQDNSTLVLAEDEIIYSENFYVAGGPQTAGMIGLNYRSKKFWFVNASINYFDNIYLDFNTSRRTASAVGGLAENDPLRAAILDQQKLSSQSTVDISGGKSWKLNTYIKSLKHQSFLVLNVGISNLFNNQNMITGGYEQLRFDYQDKDPMKFAPKYYYGFGTTYFVSLTLRMN